MKRILTIAACAAAFATVSTGASIAQAADMNALKAEAVTVVKSFGGPLKQTLGGAMKEGGPMNAIGVCNTQAPAIAQKAADASGWSVARTSLKLRNLSNAPDPWELATLQEFEKRLASGEKPDTIAKAEIVEEDGQKVFRFMKAIGTAPVCLNCHGTDITPEVADKLDSLYPHDTARGFNQGDIRGAFTLKKKL